MELKERVIDFQINKKISFDGKSYVTRLPTEVTRFLEKQGISAREVMIEGIWKIKGNVFCVVMIFGNTRLEKNFENDTDEDFVELKL